MFLHFEDKIIMVFTKIIDETKLITNVFQIKFFSPEN